MVERTEATAHSWKERGIELELSIAEIPTNVPRPKIEKNEVEIILRNKDSSEALARAGGRGETARGIHNGGTHKRGQRWIRGI